MEFLKIMVRPVYVESMGRLFHCVYGGQGRDLFEPIIGKFVGFRGLYPYISGTQVNKDYTDVFHYEFEDL